MIFFRNFLLFWAVVLGCQACARQDCEIQVQPFLKVKLVRLRLEGSRLVEDTLSVLVDKIYGIRTDQRDSAFYQDRDTSRPAKGLRLTSSANLLFTLSPTQDESRFVFNYHNKNADTVTLHYKRRKVLISETCGFTTYFDSLTDVKSKPLYKNIYKEIDSIRIETPSVNQNGQVIHVKLYFF